MSKRVPHCNKCQFCKCTELIYKSFYCEINHWNLGVDYAPLRSPKWCLLRSENVRKLHIQRLFDVLYKRNKLFMITLLDLENSEIIEGRLIGTSPSGMPIYEGVI